MMKAQKQTARFSKWMLRLIFTSVLFYKYLYVAGLFNFEDYQFYVAVLFLVSALVLFTGGFMKKPGFTVTASAVIMALLIFELVMAGGIILTNTFYLKITQFFLAFYFLSTGNSKC